MMGKHQCAINLRALEVLAYADSTIPQIPPMLEGMEPYGKRRWDWAVTKSLETLGWKSAGAIATKFTPTVVSALAGYFLLPSADGPTRIAVTIGAVVVGNLLSLGGLLLGYWWIAPAAMDAERQKEIEGLSSQLVAIATKPDWKKIREQLAELISAGETLKSFALTPLFVPESDDKWAIQVADFLRSALDESYVVRFNASQGMNERAANFPNPGVDHWKRNRYIALEIRLERLSQFVAELAQR